MTFRDWMGTHKELSMKKNLLKNLQQFLLITLLTYLALLLIRVFEYFFLSDSYGSFLSFGLFLTSIQYDAHLIVFVSFLSLIFFAVYSFYRKEFILNLYKIFLLLVLTISLGLTQYFLTNKDLLGTALFSFSLSDILSIAVYEFSSNRIQIWLLYLILPGFVVVSGLFLKIKNVSTVFTGIFSTVYVTSIILMVINGNFLLSHPAKYQEEIQYFLANNKILFMIKMANDKYFHKRKYDLKTKEEVEKAIEQYQKDLSGFEFVSEEYPMLHKDNYPNVLGKYFHRSNKKPNIVFVIVEGLSSLFVGSNARIGNLMPYLDSLISESLYWRNFYSNSKGTFGVLPSVFSSLPNGYYERGFINIPYNYPKHNSLMNILHKNGYESLFYYSGDAYFDQMHKYLRYHGVQKIYDAKILDREHFNTVVNSYWSSWGIDDKLLFRRSFEFMEDEDYGKPTLKIYLTLSIHSPYNIVPPEYLYDETVRTRLEKLDIENAEELKAKHKNALGSIFLADGALKLFFKTYSKRSDFENTIFIITGDHPMKEFPFENDLEKYHVPLIIYSPLLKSTGEFQSVSTHNDIVPSLLSLLKHHYGLKTPATVHWLGKGLNTAQLFESKSLADLGNFSGGNFKNALYNNLFAYNNNLFQINDKNSLILIRDSLVIERADRLVSNANFIWEYVTIEDKLLPN